MQNETTFCSFCYIYDCMQVESLFEGGGYVILN